MNTGIFTRIAALACTLALLGCLAGCAGGAGQSATAEQKANRAYMSQVNETMVELDASLDQFVDAVSRGDVVNMRTQADNAYKVLDKLDSIDAPDAMKDIAKQYNEGTGKLREALDEYVTLYTEASRAGDSYNWSSYEKRIADVQKLYDEGVELLKAADATIAGDASASSSSSSASSAAPSSESASSASASSEAASSESSSASSVSSAITSRDASSDSSSSTASSSASASSASA